MPPELGARHLSPREQCGRSPSLESSQGHWAETGDRSGSWGGQGDMSRVGGVRYWVIWVCLPMK